MLVVDNIQTLVDESTVLIGQRIKLAREHLGYSKTLLAEKLEISYKRIIEYENGQYKPRETTLRKMAIILDVDYYWLLTGSIIKQPKWLSKSVESKDEHDLNSMRKVTQKIIKDFVKTAPNYILSELAVIVLDYMSDSTDLEKRRIYERAMRDNTPLTPEELAKLDQLMK